MSDDFRMNILGYHEVDDVQKPTTSRFLRVVTKPSFLEGSLVWSLFGLAFVAIFGTSALSGAAAPWYMYAMFASALTTAGYGGYRRLTWALNTFSRQLSSQARELWNDFNQERDRAASYSLEAAQVADDIADQLHEALAQATVLEVALYKLVGVNIRARNESWRTSWVSRSSLKEYFRGEELKTALALKDEVAASYTEAKETVAAVRTLADNAADAHLTKEQFVAAHPEERAVLLDVSAVRDLTRVLAAEADTMRQLI